MTYNINDNDGAQALDVNQAFDRWQFSVTSGCAVSINSGTLGQADTLTVAAGDILFDGGSVSVASQTAGIDAANVSNPRKDVVYLDSTGTVQVAKGTAEAAAPSTATRFETFRPAPTDLSATNAVVLAEVWVPAGATSVTASDLHDRRVFADLAAHSMVAESAVVNNALAHRATESYGLPSSPRDGRKFAFSQTPDPTSPVAVMSFDDGYESLWTERDYIKDTLGISTSFNIITDNIGTAGYLTWEQCRTLVDDPYNWEIGCHSKTGANFGGLSQSQMVTEVRDATRKMLEEGLTPTSYVYSGGATGGQTGRGIVNRWYDVGWGVGGGTLRGNEEPTNLSRIDADGSSISTASLESEIDTAVANNVGVVFFAHKIIEGTTSDEGSIEISKGKLSDLVTYGQNNGATWGTHTDALLQTGAFFKIGGFDGGYLQRVPGGALDVVAASGNDINLWDNGKNTLGLQISGNDGVQTIQVPNIARGRIIKHLGDGRTAFQDQTDTDFFVLHPEGPAPNSNNRPVADVTNAPVQYDPQDVRNIASPSAGWTAYHDGSGSNTEGPAFYNGTSWISQVDGTTIS